MSLVEKNCVACKGEVKPLTAEQAMELAKKETPGWGLEENAKCLVRSFKFKNFAKSFEFVCGVAVEAEKQKHHPDITFGWGYATILLTTHAIGGLHENDFIMAAKINAIAEGN